jgi:ankyrin repeat protein
MNCLRVSILSLGCLTALGCSACSCEREQHIRIINDADGELGVDLTIPARVEALIQLKKLHDKKAKDMLHKAILNNSAEDVRKAAQAGADIDNDKGGKAPLLLALSLQCYVAFSELIKLGAKVDVTQEVLSIAYNELALGNIKSIILLLKEASDASGYLKHNSSSMIDAILGNIMRKECDLETALELLEIIFKHGADATEVLAKDAVYSGDMNGKRDHCSAIIKLCIKYGANLNRVQGTIRLERVTERYIKVASYTTTTPLARCIVNKDIKSIEVLLEAGADVNQKVYLGDPNHPVNGEQSPLAIAINGSDAKIIEILRYYGANL